MAKTRFGYPGHTWRTPVVVRARRDHHDAAGNPDAYRHPHVLFRFAIPGVSAQQLVGSLVCRLSRVTQVDARNRHLPAGRGTDHAVGDTARNHGRLCPVRVRTSRLQGNFRF